MRSGKSRRTHRSAQRPRPAQVVASSPASIGCSEFQALKFMRARVGPANSGETGMRESGNWARCVVRVFVAVTVVASAPAWADYRIAPVGGDITGRQLSAQLAAGDVSLVATSGDLVVDDVVEWGAHTLTLSAPAGAIDVNAVMTASGSANLVLESSATGGVNMALGGNATTGNAFIGRIDFTGSGQTLEIDGTSCVLIRDAAGMQAAAGTVLTGCLGLAADVDLAGLAGFVRLANNLQGVFDGLGHGVKLATTGEPFQLFAVTAEAAVVRNVGFPRGSVTSTALLVGTNSGSVSHVYSAVDLSADSNTTIGGLIGANLGSVRHAWVSGDVTGLLPLGSVGGLVGLNSGVIRHAWASGTVSGTYAGGLVGTQAGSIRTAYATGNVTGDHAGGLVGYQFAGDVDAVFASGGVSGGVNAGGVVGWHAGGTVANAWFTADTAGAHPDNGVGSPVTLANLVAALPPGFDSAAWANQNGRTTPYLKSVPGAVYVKAESAGAASARVYTPVSTLEQLQAIEHDVAGAYALFEDIDATPTRSWNSGQGFAPIGPAYFTGRFDGLGHVVAHLYVDRFNTSYLGLFAMIGSGGVVRGVGVEDAYVKGNQYIGALAGENDGSIVDAWASGSVSAAFDVGGLVGANVGSIDRAYSTVAAAAQAHSTGGLVGYHVIGTISRSYASGPVTGTNNVGGLAGLTTPSSSISNSYWDSYSTGRAAAVGSGGASATNVGAVTSDPAQAGAANYAFRQNAYANFNFAGDWVAFEGTRPFLRSEWQTTLTNAHQLQLMNLEKGARYTLGGRYTWFGHVDAGETGRNDGTAARSAGMWAQTGFAPVGSAVDPFTGELDGQHHVIRGLAVRNPAAPAGLFAWVTGGSLRNIGLRDVDITGAGYVAGLAVRMDELSEARNVYVTGEIKAIAAPASGEIEQAVAAGLVAVLDGSSIDASYGRARVEAVAGSSGRYDLGIVGGLVGASVDGSLRHSYASSELGVATDPATMNYAGQLVGVDNGGAYQEDFWDGDAGTTGVGSGDVAGATGLMRTQWLSQGPVASGSWDTTATWVAGYPFPLLRGFPHVRVIAQGAHVTQGVPAVTVDSYSVVDQDGFDAGAWVEGTPSWFADPDLPAGAVANIGGTGVALAATHPLHEVTYIGAGVVQPPAMPHLDLTLAQAAPHYVSYGQILDYVVTLTNSGTAPALTQVQGSFAGGADVASTTWQCIAGSVEASCLATGAGPINDSVTVPPGVSMTWLIHVPVSTSTLAGTLDFTFTAAGIDALHDSATIVIFRDGLDGDIASTEEAH